MMLPLAKQNCPVMLSPEDQERYARVAIELLRKRESRAVSMLKDFLTYISSPTDIRNVLIAAIQELMDTSPPTICWLLEHSATLQPEVDITQVVTQTFIERLTGLGFSQGQDFSFNLEQKLEISDAAKSALSSHSQLFNIQDPLPIIHYLQNSIQS